MKKISLYFKIWAVVAVSIAAAACSDNGGNTQGPEQPDGRGIYPVTITAGIGTEEATRAIWHNGPGQDGLYYWQSTDMVGLSVTPTGEAASFIVHNLAMNNNRSTSGDVLNTSFTGTYTSQQANAMSATEKYDYYSYFPYDAAASANVAFPIVRFSIPANMTLTPNRLSSENAPMTGRILGDKPITYINPNTAAQVNNQIHMKYNHVMAYMALEMDCRLIPETVTDITITCNEGNCFGGTMEVDLITGTPRWAAGSPTSNTLSITVGSGGLVAGEGDVLYIPMLPEDLSGRTFDIVFGGPNLGPDKKYVYQPLPGVRGSDLSSSRGKIRTLKVAPAAEYRWIGGNEVTEFTTTWSGHYYIEAWGGNGGGGYLQADSNSPSSSTAGGISNKIEGLFNLFSGEQIGIYLGGAGEDGSMQSSTVSAPAGGANGSGSPGFGNGGTGGLGGDHINDDIDGGLGGGGGAGTFILRGGTPPSTATTVLVSGGGGGAGGVTPIRNNPWIAGGTGGNSGSNNSFNGVAGVEGSNIGDPGSIAYGGEGGDNSQGGTGGTGFTTDSISGDNGGNGSLDKGGDGGNGRNYTQNNGGGGGGGGGAGGGYLGGGGGGGGGARNPNDGNSSGGGGGGGGASYKDGAIASTDNPKSTNNSRTGINGYVVITPIR